MDKTKINLDAPAFGEGAQPIEEVSEETTQETESTEQENETEATESEEEVVEESKVPYSRFKKFHDEAKKAQEEADYWRQEAMRRQTERTESNDELPEYWLKTFGDDENSKNTWKVQKQINDEIKREAIEAAKTALRQEQQEEAARTQENIQTIDNNFETLSTYLGRDLTEKEQSALLDIVDEYTPKDDDGNYLGAIMSFDKAWEIMELKSKNAQAPRKQARDVVASLSGSRSQGDVVITEKDKDFKPGNWFSFEKRL